MFTQENLRKKQHLNSRQICGNLKVYDDRTCPRNFLTAIIENWNIIYAIKECHLETSKMQVKNDLLVVATTRDFKIIIIMGIQTPSNILSSARSNWKSLATTYCQELCWHYVHQLKNYTSNRRIGHIIFYYTTAGGAARPLHKKMSGRGKYLRLLMSWHLLWSAIQQMW